MDSRNLQEIQLKQRKLSQQEGVGKELKKNEVSGDSTCETTAKDG